MNISWPLAFVIATPFICVVGIGAYSLYLDHKEHIRRMELEALKQQNTTNK